ncbi:MAG: hypothetical protein WC606_04315 [Candidatus Absconditabacterales bacterium]|jgi:hypothetical protein
MKPTEKKLQDFSGLPNDQKYEIVLEMLKILQDSNDNFKYVYENIQTINEPSDKLLMTIYKEIIELAEKKREESHKLEMLSFEKMKQNIDSIKQKEKEEKQGEDPDQLLQNI